KAVKVAADTFRPNPAFSTAEVITQMGIGEALVSVLEDKGIPSMVGRTLIRPPSAQVGPIGPAEREAIVANSPVGGLYDTEIDRESALEILQRRARERQLVEERNKLEEADRKAAEARRSEERRVGKERRSRWAAEA